MNTMFNYFNGAVCCGLALTLNVVNADDMKDMQASLQKDKQGKEFLDHIPAGKLQDDGKKYYSIVDLRNGEKVDEDRTFILDEYTIKDKICGDKVYRDYIEKIDGKEYSVRQGRLPKDKKADNVKEKYIDQKGSGQVQVTDSYVGNVIYRSMVVHPYKMNVDHPWKKNPVALSYIGEALGVDVTQWTQDQWTSLDYFYQAMKSKLPGNFEMWQGMVQAQGVLNADQVQKAIIFADEYLDNYASLDVKWLQETGRNPVNPTK